MVQFIDDTAPKSQPRRKVIVGGALMAMAKSDPDAARILAQIKRSQVRPAERKLFEV